MHFVRYPTGLIDKAQFFFLCCNKRLDNFGKNDVFFASEVNVFRILAKMHEEHANYTIRLWLISLISVISLITLICIISLIRLIRLITLITLINLIRLN